MAGALSEFQLNIEICCEDSRWDAAIPDADDVFGQASRMALEHVGIKLAEDAESVLEISVMLADNIYVRQLNCDYRGKDRPTNILSFQQLGAEQLDDLMQGDCRKGDFPGNIWLLGDIVLAYETIFEESRAGKKKFTDHLSHLIVHGVLHLLGYDHEIEDEAVEMERLETEVLAKLGLDDPYLVME